MAGIYIHIPFCKQACSYCDFYFVTRQKLRDDYIEGLLNEIRSYQQTSFTDEPVRTIYIGGGTPSLLPAGQLAAIFEALEKTFDIRAEEITLEMNPDDVSANYLAALKDLGITRASMGVQTFQPELLEFMNRAHTREEALQCLELLSSSDFDAFTVDLIYGNPDQTLQQLSEDLDLLLDFNPPHISAYSLTVEPGTRLGKQVSLGRINPPKDHTVAEQFHFLNDRLAEQDIFRYEVSNYSKLGCEAKHNSNYWRHKNYLGFGPGAHSFWWGKQPVRWQNKADLRSYLNQPEQEKEQLSMHQLAEEYIMLGLRTRTGISAETLQCHYNYKMNKKQWQFLEKQQGKNMLQIDDNISLTEQGIIIADAITLDLISRQD